MVEGEKDDGRRRGRVAGANAGNWGRGTRGEGFRVVVVGTEVHTTEQFGRKTMTGERIDEG